MNQLATTQNNAVTPVQLLEMAVSKGTDLDQLQKLMDLQERWEASEAKKAFTSAMSEFKKETIEITKNKTVTYTNQDNSETSYTHATLDHIIDMATPKLSQHGLSHKWSMAQGEGGRITVSCELTHSLGHSECVSMSASPDDSGKKNNIQRIASTVTYLERYTFLMITGLAAKGLDDDGAASGERYDAKQIVEIEMRGISYMMACYKHKEVIEEVKDCLADNNLLAAAEALFSLTNKELISIRRAPTKGGIFTLEETKKMSGDEWEAAKKQGHELNPNVDRSL
jgi:hypothetical protein